MFSLLTSTNNNQSSASKPKSTNKGFFNCIAKNLFKCKSKRYQSQNYEYISYGAGQTQNTSAFDTSDMPRAVSTMIQDPTLNASTENFNFDKTSEISIYISDEQLHNQFLIPNEETTICDNTSGDETEVTRRTSFNSLNYCSREEVTIVRKSTSPISNVKLQIASLSETCDYMHSTKITEQDLSRQQSTYQLERSRDLMHFNDHLKYVDSIIQNSRSVDATHACIQDYEATFVDDVSVSFADSLTVLKNDNEEFLYVQVESDGRRGFVPRNVVVGIDEFIAQLNQHKRLTSSMNFSINV